MRTRGISFFVQKAANILAAFHLYFYEHLVKYRSQTSDIYEVFYFYIFTSLREIYQLRMFPIYVSVFEGKGGRLIWLIIHINESF